MNRRLCASLGALATAILLQGCPSAYQRTYDAETEKLEAQRQAELSQAEAEHAQAQKYAAVIYFATGSAVIDDAGQRELRWFVQQMLPYQQALIRVQGFADATGSQPENAGLSNQRAAAVAAYLNSKGIAPTRIQAEGFGDQYPAASNESAKGRRDNRRVEVTVR